MARSPCVPFGNYLWWYCIQGTNFQLMHKDYTYIYGFILKHCTIIFCILFQAEHHIFWRRAEKSHFHSDERIIFFSFQLFSLGSTTAYHPSPCTVALSSASPSVTPTNFMYCSLTVNLLIGLPLGLLAGSSNLIIPLSVYHVYIVHPPIMSKPSQSVISGFFSTYTHPMIYLSNF